MAIRHIIVGVLRVDAVLCNFGRKRNRIAIPASPHKQPDHGRVFLTVAGSGAATELANHDRSGPLRCPLGAYDSHRPRLNLAIIAPLSRAKLG